MDICATDSASLSNPISLLLSAHTCMAFPRISFSPSPPSSLLEEELGMDGENAMLTNVLTWGDVKNKLLFRPQGFMYSLVLCARDRCYILCNDSKMNFYTCIFHAITPLKYIFISASRVFFHQSFILRKIGCRHSQRFSHLAEGC